MKKTAIHDIPSAPRLTDTTANLAGMLGCGRSTAIKIGEAAKAKIRIGTRVLWNLAKIQEYLNSVSYGTTIGGNTNEL